MKQCWNFHAIAHMLFGIGLGIAITGMLPSVYRNSVTIGIIITTLAFGIEFLIHNKS